VSHQVPVAARREAKLRGAGQEAAVPLVGRQKVPGTTDSSGLLKLPIAAFSSP